ncbi:ankyrin repeat-containing domain protein [Lactarius akahatsu]|uniref:Ankyrin repeat-containing domain protein n=1 Tax=Lactarius akahatsu TaxID=416441 RepID=A0AAD4Q6L6_9AGAM|nr:ankyrin repeat-containing domain protein [Lactarius akahatsu]
MSSGPQASSSSTPNFRPIFEKALEEYKKKTGKDLTTHPLAAEINGCDSPEAILVVLEGKANELNQSRRSDDRLTKWLNPTVNILNALSAILGDSAGSVFPPAKIILSGIGILLVAARSTVANRDVLVKLFGRIESFFERLEVYTNVPPSLAVTDELAKIMAEVLSILATATSGMKERRIKIFLKKVAGMNDLEDALQRFGELEQRELLTGIAQVSSDTNVLKDDARDIKADAKETKADAKETKAMVKEIADKMDARDLEGVLQKLKGWLSPSDPSTNYNIGLRDLHEATTTWFLESRIFQEWHSNGSLLWIHGKPGSGKSVLCSAIIQRILSLRHGGRASVAYFYFDFRDENKKHRHDLLPSLLIQFAAHSIHCCDIMSRVYSAHGKGTQQPSDDVLINCLTDMLSTTTQHPIYIVLDAIDECPNTSGVRSPRERVLSLIKRLIDLRLRNLHICVTSRPEVDIRIRLEPLTSRRVSLHDQTGHREDITRYIRSEADVLANDNRWREDDKQLVIETLSEKADGMFRWVYCQLEMLRLCLRSRVRQFLNELPDSLDETYERVLKEIHKTNQLYAQRLLQCLTVAIRPLRVDELAAILTFEVDAIEGEVPTLDADWGSEDQEQELLSACPSLITIVGRRRSRVVQFSHFSVKEFLTSDRLAVSSEDILRYHVLPEAAHTTLAQGSLGVLLCLDERVDARGAQSDGWGDGWNDGWGNGWSENWGNDSSDGWGDGWNDTRTILPNPPVRYAAEHWVSHAQVGSVSLHVTSRMKTLFDLDKPHFAAWVQIHDIDQPWDWDSLRDSTAKPLYYSALCGFCDLVEHLAKKHPQHVNDFGGEYGYPLVAALHRGHIRVAELLFQLGANVDVRGTEEQTPLHIVLRWPYNSAVGAVQFLLQHGADVNVRRKDLSTALHLAADWWDFEVGPMLLCCRVGVNSRNAGGKALPFPKNEGNCSNLVQLLLEHGAEVNFRDKNDSTALHYTLLKQCINVARLLLDHGADVNAEDNFGRTPLHLVSEAEGYSDEVRFSVAQLLIERGADVNARDKDHKTPLHYACSPPKLELVRILLDYGANIDAEDNWGRTPLHRMLGAKGQSDKDRLAVAQLLVKRGADVNAQDEDHETPLHFVSYFLEVDLVRTLLDHGAIINVEDNLGQTPLHLALEDKDYSDEDRFGVAQLLVERGADVNAQDEDHKTPLHSASYFPEIKLVWMLLDYGANVNAEDNLGRTPLLRVLEAEDYVDEYRFGVACLLVERGADVNVRDEDHETPLHYACYPPELKLAWMLLDHGANINAVDKWGRTPLGRMLEAKEPLDEDRSAVAQLLVEHGADVNAQDEDRETPLHFASHFLERNLVQMLLDHGANVNAEDSLGRTPLHLVLEDKNYFDERHFGVARLLVERGADVNVRGEDHETPLHSASYSLEFKWVRMLLDHGANANAEDNLGRTPLHLVLEDRDYTEHHFGMARLLVEHGADANIRDKDHKTPLHSVSYFLELNLVRTLLDHGAIVNAEDSRGRTPLHRVLEAEEDGSAVAQLLIERGADVNMPNGNHDTPLHIASRLVLLEAVWILLKSGADLNAENKEGQLPFQLLRETIREEMQWLPSAYSNRLGAGRARRAECVALMGLLYGY